MSSPAKLNHQSLFVSYSVGGPISAPVDPSKLTAVLDIGAGTAAWLAEIAALPTLPALASLFGIDVAPSKFPSPPSAIVTDPTTGAETTRELTLIEHDAAEPLPAEWDGKFDLVNMRHFFGWVDVDKHDAIYRNVLRVLKPGGWIQCLDTRMNLEEDMTTYSPRIKKYVAISSKAFGLYEPSQLSRRRILLTLPTHLQTLGYSPSSTQQYTKPLNYGALQTDERYRASSVHQMISSITRVFKAEKRCYVDLDAGEERVKVEVDGVVYEVPGNDEEWDAFAAESEKVFNEEGWALPIHITLAQKPLSE